MQGNPAAARLGAAFSALLLASSVWLRVALAAGEGCYTSSGGDGGLNPLLFAWPLVAVVALVLDIRALRRGPRESWWGRLGLTLFGVAGVVFAWWFVAALDQLLSCID